MSRRAVRNSTVGAMVLATAMLAMAGSASAGVGKVPKGFLWGVSSSAFQSEGHTTGANWNHYIERDNGPTPVGKPKDPYKNSVDFYTHHRSDIALAAKLGIDTYRISINWTRIEPKRGVFSQQGLRFYDHVLKEMARKGIQPLITLNHWDYPQWVYDQGGWTSTRTVDDFAKMTKLIADRYGRQVKYWLTFNEEFFFEFIEQGNYPLTDAQVLTMRTNLIAAHRRAYDLIHRASPSAMVSTNYAWPGRGSLASLETDRFMNAVADKLDYAALDFYYPAYDQAASLIGLSSGTPWAIPVDPFGMYTALRSMHRRFPRLPVLITENGMGTDDGATRADGVTRQQLMTDTLYWVQRARQDGVPVIGYLYWGLTDTYEWGHYAPRFGLYRVDVQTDPTLKRRPTAAVKTFRGLIASRGVPGTYRLAEKPVAANCQTDAVAPADRTACTTAAGR